MNKKEKILIIRFSAMGDVAMTAPIVKQVAEQNQEYDFFFVSRKLFKPFFNDIPNLEFIEFDPKQFKGFWGLRRFYLLLKKLDINIVADLHFNLRSRVVSSFFKLAGARVVHLEKGRAEKKALTSRHHKILTPLKPMWQRYAEVFEKIGLKTRIKTNFTKNNKPILPSVATLVGGKDANFWVGISPFAQHAQKVYPLEKMEEVVGGLNIHGIKTFIFGGGALEKAVGEEWEKRFEHCISVIGKLSLEEELNLIGSLDIMISMDSAGMHLASLENINVVSVWGATHPYAGFLGYGQKEENCVQADLYCRPCSVYGNKPCFRGDLACMNLIEPKIIIEKTLHLLKNPWQNKFY